MCNNLCMGKAPSGCNPQTTCGLIERRDPICFLVRCRKRLLCLNQAVCSLITYYVSFEYFFMFARVALIVLRYFVFSVYSVCRSGLVVSTCQMIGLKDYCNETAGEYLHFVDYLHKDQVEECVTCIVCSIICLSPACK